MAVGIVFEFRVGNLYGCQYHKCDKELKYLSTNGLVANKNTTKTINNEQVERVGGMCGGGCVGKVKSVKNANKKNNKIYMRNKNKKYKCLEAKNERKI